MDRTFNNGVGMIAIIPPGKAEAVLVHLRRLRTPAYLVGEVRKARRGRRERSALDGDCERGAKDAMAERAPVKLGVLISGTGTNLQAIIDAVERGELRAEIRVVISNRAGVQGLERAHRHGIPTRS